MQRLTVLSSLGAQDKAGAIISYLFAFLLYSPPLASSPVDINRRWLLALKGIRGEAGGVCCCWPGSDLICHQTSNTRLVSPFAHKSPSPNRPFHPTVMPRCVHSKRPSPPPLPPPLTSCKGGLTKGEKVNVLLAISLAHDPGCRSA